jgi:hypothetical protein
MFILACRRKIEGGVSGCFDRFAPILNGHQVRGTSGRVGAWQQRRHGKASVAC